MAFLSSRSLNAFEPINVAFLAVPLAMAAAAVWAGYRSSKFALALELVLLAAGAFCWIIVAAASGA
jgi:small neutral amino acid transporter SnatA (MarC family)